MADRNPSTTGLGGRGRRLSFAHPAYLSWARATSALGPTEVGWEGTVLGTQVLPVAAALQPAHKTMMGSKTGVLREFNEARRAMTVRVLDQKVRWTRMRRLRSQYLRIPPV